MASSSPPFGGFIVSIPSAGILHGLYVPPDKSYRVAPPAGWEIIPGGDGAVEFRSRLADQGYWPGMFIAKELAEGSQPQEAVEINALIAGDRKAFRFISGEPLDLPVGTAYLVIYEHIFKGLRMKTAEAHIVSGGWQYWLPFNALAASFDRHFPSYLNALRSFAPVEPGGGRVYN